MLLSKSQRSPKEEFLYSNFPEVATIQPQLDSIYAYVTKVQKAIEAYDERRADKIYLNIAELRNMFEVSHDVTDILGRAPNICYDLLINLRSIQEGFLELLYSHLAHGNEVVSTEPYQPFTEEHKNAI